MIMNANLRGVSLLLKRFLPLCLLLLGFVCSIGSARAVDRTFTLKISKDQKNPSRGGLVRPVGDGGKWTFRFELDSSLELVNPPQPSWTRTTSKKNPNEGEQNWGVWMQAKDALPPAGPDPDNSWLAFSSPDEPGGTFSATVTAKARSKRGPGGANGPAGPDDEFTFTATWSGEVSDITVEFDSDLYRAGFALTDGAPDPASSIGKTTVTATVTPKEQTNNINIVPGEGEGITNRISITNIVKDAATGKMTFDLRGTSASEDQNGDSLIAAKKIDDGKVVGTAKVVVVIPRTIGKPYPQFEGAVSAQNKAVNAQSTPAFRYKDENTNEITNVPQGKVVLATYYMHVQIISVVDQFGMPLDSLYVGAKIEEDFPPIFAINQELTDRGTYLDPVSFFFTKRDNENNVVEVDIGSQAAQDWENQLGAGNAPIRPREELIASGDVDVIVAGHALNPGITGRFLRLTPGIPTRLRIRWIDRDE